MLSIRPAQPFFILLSLFLISASTGCFTPRESTTTNTNSAAERQLRQEIVRYALSLEGSSYKYSGISPRTGFDCSGFTSYVLKQFKIPVSSASTSQSTEGWPVDLKSVQPGDLIIFGKNKRNIQHVAMVVERNRKGIIVVHSTTSRGVIRENISTSTYWEPLILSARNVISK